uniref:Uncharacterized protein n=1 Tax=Salix viminalis TaxID=40686 RepID=A0A6N2MBP9_SALVM
MASSGHGVATTKSSSAAASLIPDTWNEPKRVEGLDQVQVTAAFASGVVSAAIGDDGSLWVWGRSKRGQLGLGKGITEASVPSIVEALEGIIWLGARSRADCGWKIVWLGLSG